MGADYRVSNKQYDRQAAQRKKILSRLAKGETLTSICKADKTLPTANIVREWVFYDKYGFADQYYLARDMGIDAMVDECVDISDQVGQKTARDKLRIETRKWLVDKVAPKRYRFLAEGDTVEDREAARATVKGMTDEEINEKIEAIRQKGIARIKARVEGGSDDSDATDLV